MCLIVLGWRVRPDFPLIVATNRDELHARPAERAGFWKDHPSVLAGRDLEAKGTWLGVSRSGRFAAVTNYRGGRDANAAESRGALVTGFLLSSRNPGSYVSELFQKKNNYSGFNLLVAADEELWWLSNRDGGTRRLEPGIYGLGNFLLDTPELTEPKARFTRSIASGLSIEPLFSVLAAAKLVASEYGTRCSTVLLADSDGRMQFAERPFDPSGADGSTVRYEFRRSA